MTNIPIVVNSRIPVGPRIIQPNPLDKIVPDVSPEEMNEDITMVGKEYAEGYEAAIWTVLREGIALFTKSPPRIRYMAYMRTPILPTPTVQPTIDQMGNVLDPGQEGNPGRPYPGTFPDEVPYVLTPDYGDRVRAGTLPMPRSPMWQLLFTKMPAFVVDYLLKDFSEVYATMQKRIDKTVENFSV